MHRTLKDKHEIKQPSREQQTPGNQILQQEKHKYIDQGGVPEMK